MTARAPLSAFLLLGTFALAHVAGCGGGKDEVIADAPAEVRARQDLGAAHFVSAEPGQKAERPAAELAVDVPAPNAGVVLAGSINAEPLQLPHAIFLRGRANVADQPETLVFAISDQPDLCRHLQEGTMPANSTMLAVALLGAKEGFVPGTRFYPGGEQDDEERPSTSTYLRRLNDRCEIWPSLGQLGAEARYGYADLTGIDAKGGSVDFSLEFTDDYDRSLGTLRGQVGAAYCDAPRLFLHATQFYSGRTDPKDCRQP